VTATATDTALTLAMAGREERLTPAFDPETRMDAEIWGQTVSASLADETTNETLSSWFGRPVRLVHADAEMQRRCNPDWAGEVVSTGFSDGYPVLIATTGSLAAVNAATEGEAAGMERFRPNIVIECDDPFAEDFWARIEIGAVIFDLVKPCPRCIMTTQDQATGERTGADPMPAMRKLRMSADRRVAGVLFGWNAVPRTAGVIACGDVVRVVEARKDGWPLHRR
jgi:uncharacterized protein YcbX